MSNIRSNNPFSYRDLIYKALIFVCTVTVIAYFLPRDNSFNYQFDINKPWKYGQLIATFDFPIYKDESVVKHDLINVLHLSDPEDSFVFLLNYLNIPYWYLEITLGPRHSRLLKT